VEREDPALDESRREPPIRSKGSRAQRRQRAGGPGRPCEATDLEPRGPHLLEQDVGLVTPDVTACVVQRRPHRRVDRGRHHEQTAGTDDPGDLVEECHVVVDVLQDLEREGGAEGPALERKAAGGLRGPRASRLEAAERVQ
jgi:hypothetical protein